MYDNNMHGESIKIAHISCPVPSELLDKDETPVLWTQL